MQGIESFLHLIIPYKIGNDFTFYGTDKGVIDLVNELLEVGITPRMIFIDPELYFSDRHILLEVKHRYKCIHMYPYG